MTPFFSIFISIVAIVVGARPRSEDSAAWTSVAVASPRVQSTRMIASCRSPRLGLVFVIEVTSLNYRDSTTMVVSESSKKCDAGLSPGRTRSRTLLQERFGGIAEDQREGRGVVRLLCARLRG